MDMIDRDGSIQDSPDPGGTAAGSIGSGFFLLDGAAVELAASTAGLIVRVERHRREPLPGDRYVAILTGRRG
jgi:hypothetical protein